MTDFWISTLQFTENDKDEKPNLSWNVSPSWYIGNEQFAGIQYIQLVPFDARLNGCSLRFGQSTALTSALTKFLDKPSCNTGR